MCAQDPERHQAKLREVAELLQDADPQARRARTSGVPRDASNQSAALLCVQVARLAMLSLLVVFRDLVPGYRIRPPSDKELEMNVSAAKQRGWQHLTACVTMPLATPLLPSGVQGGQAAARL